MIILLISHKSALKRLYMSKQLYLYSTSHCHLCDLAHAIVVHANVSVKTIEITDDEALLIKYGLRIPVLQRLDTLTELNWPFSENDIIELLK